MGYIDIVFDGPPEHVAGRFVEVEDETGASVAVGDWLQRPDGYWVLRIERPAGPIQTGVGHKQLEAMSRAVHGDWEVGIRDVDLGLTEESKAAHIIQQALLAPSPYIFPNHRFEGLLGHSVNRCQICGYGPNVPVHAVVDK